MTDEAAEGLPEPLRPLAFLIGTWIGVGVGGYPTIESFRYGQELTIAVLPGRPVLAHSSRTWLLDDEGNTIGPSAAEVGWWRPQPGGEVELLLAHPTGISEVYVGRVEGTRAEVATDAVVRTSSAKEVTAGHRLYGLVEGALLYAVDQAMVGQDLQSHLSARLERSAPGHEEPPGGSA